MMMEAYGGAVSAFSTGVVWLDDGWMSTHDDTPYSASILVMGMG